MQRDVLARNLGPTYVSSAVSANDASSSVVAQGAVLANKYRVERVLGQGGMGYVVEARHITLDERIALKFLLPEYAKHPEASARFLREARAAVKIKSEHVARVSDVGTLDSGAPYMVMEFLDGADLAQTLQRIGVLQVDDALDYILQASEAIAEAHAHGIVHRDLKPANLFLAKRPDGSPLVKVLDFGISKVMGGAAEHGLTKTTTAMGSALYMSPEQMQETRGVDQRTDIYSMGIALFELLAGRQPFYAETLPQLCAEVLTGVPTPMSAFRPDVPRNSQLVSKKRTNATKTSVINRSPSLPWRLLRLPRNVPAPPSNALRAWAGLLNHRATITRHQAFESALRQLRSSSHRRRLPTQVREPWPSPQASMNCRDT